ncbi:PAS domain S-box protein [Paludibaculum fermentans]|uniref:histidine kinase n=1 Tax=Paludibaculum fermentans TaxID=1473598 RepID=A0A7S7SJ36_PALFE|nr:PAS domain S-box protein [Paludibaculum fermentans]QOY86769.1 PAS domain S-box protein [Paludibaculum fermentans]
MKQSSKGSSRAVSPVQVLALLMTGIAVAGFFYLLHLRREFDSEVHLRVDAAANMKAADVAAWRGERLADAEVLAAGIKHTPLLLHILHGEATPLEQAQAREWLGILRTQYRYASVTLVGLRGEVLLSVGQTFEDAQQLQAWIARMGDTSGIAYSAPEAVASRRAPLLSANIVLRSLQGEKLGYLLLGIEPENYLFPTLRDWVGAGQTGELLLVRREGDSVLFLNSTRLRPGSALTVRQPLSKTELPSVRAVLGESGSIDGMDYRGAAVVAAACLVPGSDWYVVAKMDRSEALAPELRATIQFSIQLAVLMLLSGALVWLILRRQSGRFYLEKYRSEIERNRLLSMYNSLSRHANDAILVFERDGRIIEVNDRAVEMFGYSREEMLAMRIPQLKPDQHADDFERVMKVVEERKSVVFETANRRKDGRSFPTEVSSSEILVDDHCVYQSILRDISERKLAEQQIQRLNHLYAVLSRCNAAIARARSEDELFHEVCRIAVESGGFHVSWVGQVDPETSMVLPLAKNGPAAAYLDEVRIETGSGPLSSGPTGACIREGRAVASADFDTDPHMTPWRETAARYGLRSSICLPVSRRGRTAYVLGLYSSEPGFFCAEEIDLAEEVGESLSLALARIDLERDRERAERDRLLAQERLEFALDAANEGYWDWDIEKDQRFLSPRFCTMLGYQPGELASDYATWREVTHPDDRARLDNEQESLKSGRISSTSVEFRARHKDGHYVWILGSAKVVGLNDAGRPRRIVGSRVDITQRKFLEQQVLQSQKLESVGRLAGSVAHDFNNHLTVINGYSGLLQQEAAPGSVLAESLNQIHEAGERAAALTRQLLAFSRKEIEHCEALNPNSVIEGLQKMLSRLMGENVILHLDLDPEAGFVMVDATHLEQILMNLAINARDAISRSGHVHIRTAKVILEGNEAWPNRSGPHLELTVTDDGSGMTPEVLQHIFEPFFTTKDRTHGTGLGLSTVYGIVERSAGFLDVESETGRGSSFHIYLPSIPDPEGATAGLSHSRDGLMGHETVLVVEDDESVRGIAVGILKHYGYQVLQAANGGDALAMQNRFEGRIDLVISDLMMPGMSGTELVQHLQCANPQLKVLYVSGYAGESIRKEEFLSTGARFVPKPYTPETLLRVVRELLSNPGTGRVEPAV